MMTLNIIGKALARDLHLAALERQHRDASRSSGQNVHVVGAGGALTAAYEQLRNAAEYTEEHVLLQRAIRRFYRRIFILRDHNRIAQSGEELIIELTQAGYLLNDSVPESLVSGISTLATSYFDVYHSFIERRDIKRDSVDSWTYELLAVEIDALLNHAPNQDVFVQFSHQYFSEILDFDTIFANGRPDDAEAALYVAVHRALLKSDDAVVRAGLLRRYRQSVSEGDAYVQVNQMIDVLFKSSTIERLFRIVDRRGAPLRVLRHMIEEQGDIEASLANRNQFLIAFENQVNTEYATINAKVNNGIIKSVVFLVITKFLIGLAIEIPYDLLVLGTIIWTPLLINLFFPPAYMLLLRSTMMLPGAANTRRLVEQIDAVLYQDVTPKQLARRPKQEFGSGYNIAYAVLFVVVFGGVAFALWHFFHFELLHLFIFFIFLSAASFLGFRLSRMIREIESIETYQNGITLARDFLYMPFVVVGRYLSDRYAKINLVALMLDMLIELPLKTILRLFRQWSAFISAKKDEL